jgi:hypothetical protein
MREKSKFRRDPDEFRPPRVKENEALEYYFRVLPELHKGQKCKTGICDMDNDLWYYENGFHFYENTRHPCPRIHDGQDCPLCSIGFQLMRDVSDPTVRQRIARDYLARTYYAVNIYFLNIEKNPESLRGKVMWYNMPLQIWKMMDTCINSDNPGDAEEPLACGIFYHPYEGGYNFKLRATKKGDYNNYEQGSGFLAQSFGPLVKSKTTEPDREKIEEILAQRIILQSKFPPRSTDGLEQTARKLLHKEQSGGEEKSDKMADEEVDEIIGPMKGAAKTLSVKSEKSNISNVAASPATTTVASTSLPTSSPSSPPLSSSPPSPPQKKEEDEELSNLLAQIKAKAKPKS